MPVIPTKVGIQSGARWIPTFVGMTHVARLSARWIATFVGMTHVARLSARWIATFVGMTDS